MKLQISNHPSGGFCLHIPVIQEMVIYTFNPFAVWSNGTKNLHKILEFSREPFNNDIDYFEMWVKMTALASRTTSKDNLVIERI